MKIKIDHLLISICSAILVGYLLILFKVICLKYLSISDIVSHLELMKHHRPYNLVPFATIKFYLLCDSMPLLRRAGNIFGNIALFVPIGMLLPVVFRFAQKFLPLLAISVLLSSILELFQYTLGTGSADIDDVILNTLGGLSGYVIFLILKASLKSENKTMAASLILFMILFITGGWVASLEFKLDLGFMTGSTHEVEIQHTNLSPDTLMVLPVRNADLIGRLEEVSGDTLKINEYMVKYEHSENSEKGAITMVMSDADKSTKPLSMIVVSGNTCIIRKDVTQYSTIQFDVQYSLSGPDSIPLKCKLHIWKAYPDSIYADTVCYWIVRKP